MQGLATVLYERFVYDEDGQLRTTTLLDYLLPTAAEVPDIEIEHLESPPQGPIDFRGVGESGSDRRAGGAVERDRRRARTLRCARHRTSTCRPTASSRSFIKTQHFVNILAMTTV